MKTLLIVYHTLTGGTRQMAEAAAREARAQEGVAVRLLRAVEAGPDDVLTADGYLFAAPENLAAIAGLMQWLAPVAGWTVLHELFSGALLFGAFYIATDPVTSPLTPRGKFVFGLGVGALVMLIRKLSGYPEGVMFAVLIMNAVVPLINQWTIPTPVGGVVPEKKS